MKGERFDMAKQITRTFDTHYIYGGRVELENGEIIVHDLEPIAVFNQGVNQEKAIKLLQKNFGKTNQYVVKEIKTETKTYGLDFDFFMEHAEVIEK